MMNFHCAYCAFKTQTSTLVHLVSKSLNTAVIFSWELFVTIFFCQKAKLWYFMKNRHKITFIKSAAANGQHAINPWCSMKRYIDICVGRRPTTQEKSRLHAHWVHRAKMRLKIQASQFAIAVRELQGCCL